VWAGVHHFVDLLAIAVRDLHPEQVFVLRLDKSKAKKIADVDDSGMQVSGITAQA
jgi:hypothetical protein